MLEYVREHDAWVDSVRERMREQRDELLPALPFDVWGLSSPRLLPYALTDIDSESVTLRYGAAGPLVTIRSERYVRRRKSRLPVSARRRTGSIVVAASRMDVELTVDDESWAAEIRAPMSVLLTVRGYRVLPESVWLVPVDDLAAYWSRS
jgi:hypothetical protein